MSSKPLNTGNKIDLDHYRIKNHRNLRIKFPRSIDSLLNLRAVINSEHVMSNQKGWGDYQQRMLEAFLVRHPKISAWANAPIKTMFGGQDYGD